MVAQQHKTELFLFRFPFHHRRHVDLDYQILCKLDNRRRTMTSYRFYKIAAIESKSTPGFWFGHVVRLRRSKAIGIPNFYQISQSPAEILLFPHFWK